MTTTGGGGGKKPSKPFLGDDDLLSELDAWDATFDALHGVDEAKPDAAATLEIDPAAVEAMARQTVTPSSLIGATSGIDELDEQLTLDGAIPADDATAGDTTFDRDLEPTAAIDRASLRAAAFAPTPSITAVEPIRHEHDALETDFSTVGSEIALGAPGRTQAPTTPPPARISAPAIPDMLPPIEEEEEEVFTSASRPRAPAAPPSDDDELRFDDDEVAPPPTPVPAVPVPPAFRPATRTSDRAQTVPRTPAIIRRSIPDLSARHTPIDDGAFGEENTRVSSIHEIEAARAESRPYQIPETQVPVRADDDDYELEIESPTGATPDPDAPAADAARGRTGAHVFRRNEQITKPPPVGGVQPLPAVKPLVTEDDEHVIEMQVGDDDDDEPSRTPQIPAAASARSPELPPVSGTLPLRAPAQTRPPPTGPSPVGAPAKAAGEDDFSDVAASLKSRPDVPALELDAPSVALDVSLGLDAPIAPTPVAPAPIVPPARPSDDDLGLEFHEYPVETPAPRAAPPTAPPPVSLPPVTPPVVAAPRPVEHYARVKTPTSVPPLGLAEKLMPTGASGATRTFAGVPLPVKGEEGSRPYQAPAPEAPLDLSLELDTIGRAWPDQVEPLATTALDESSAQALLIYEREIATVDDSAASAALRIEAGRLSERLADLDRARGHYDAALLADPRATTALRGLRRIARANGDLAEATRHLEAEMAVAGGLERRPLGHYRVDLLMANGDQDLARVAVGEILDSAPSDVRALLAQLELAFLDGRADEFGSALEQLAQAVGDVELRAAVQSARGVLAAHQNDTGGAATWFAAAAESDPTSLAARLGAIRQAAANANAEAAARGLVDLARQLEATDPTTAAAAAIRAQQWTTGELAVAAAQIALDGAPDDPLVARLASDTALAISTAIAAATPEDGQAEAHAQALAEARAVTGQAFARWAKCATSPSEQAYAAARAAELDPSRGVELWSTVLAFDPGDDYAAAQLRTAHVGNDATQAAIDVDLGVAKDPERDRARLRAAYGQIGLGRLDDAIAVLVAGRAARPGSIALAEALGEALAAGNRWTERAQLFAELAQDGAPVEQLDRDVATLRSALAWEEAVGAAAADGGAAGSELEKQAIARGLDAWARVLEHSPSSPTAHAASLLLAKRLGDKDVLADALARAQAAERSPWATATLALQRARLVDDPEQAEQILHDAAPQLDDPRRTVELMRGAAARKELGDAAVVLEERAALLDGHPTEAATLRLRAAQLALDGGDAVRATTLLGKVEQALPHVGVVPDLLAAARRRSGDRPAPISQARRSETPTTASADAFARIVRDADLAASHDDHAGALALYQRALEMKPGDPLAAVPLVRVATHLRQAAPVASLALAQLKEAESAGDNAAKASAYELLARIDAELRDDPGSAQIALESASQADPSRVDLMHRLERTYAEQDQLGELVRLRAAEIETIPADLAKDRAAALVDLAGLAARDRRPEDEIAAHYRAALAADAKTRLALLHLEAIVRREGASAELADLEDKIAQYFERDAKAAATFQTRSGETLAEIGQIDVAVQRFVAAEATLPGHIPALEGWRQAALKGQLWVDAAAAASRQAAVTTDAKVRAALHHFAGVALMDKALAGDQAMPAFHRAIDADPSHKDAFLRLRILLEEDGNHDDLATLLAKRLDFETEPNAKMEMHRALAELCRNFLSDRETAKTHYRAILALDPNDLRAHSALADIAWELGSWQEAADALVARARLERQPEVLKTLCFRLGLIYADYLVDVPMALKAFQQALQYSPDDENTLIRLADLATDAGEWKLALGACERLVKQETEPDRRVAHLHRVAKIFKQGFGDAKRAERALNLALDGAPTSDEALSALVKFYKDANDLTSVRVHLNRVAGAMRARAVADPKDGIAYRVISRAMAARAQAGVPGSLPIARAGAQLADLLGVASDPEKALLELTINPDVALLAKPEADEVLFPRTMQPELRSLFQLLGDRIAKHVGVSLQPYGVARGDRQRGRDSGPAAFAQSVATSLGFGEIDVYVSQKQPWVMVAEPTSPVSLVIGSAIAEAGVDAIRFAAGSALKLAQASLAIPARQPADELGVLVVALVRLFQPDFPIMTLDADAIGAQLQKLRRLIPNNLMTELRAFGLAIDGQRFDHASLARDLKITGLRAGLVASGSLLTGLRILAAQSGASLPDFLGDPVAQGLVTFALGEDHAAVAR